ncbi:MAG: hypothetical protein J7M34_14155 [Anaerolineae bacterium]|nr:hypothetical protein [Anaerolineae bacterium]
MKRSQISWSGGLVIALVMIAAGYWGPWVAHKTAALVITGLDLAEYVKFLPEYRSHQLHIVREGFYLPALGLSLALSLLAWQREVRWPTAVRLIAWLASVSAALVMLPPAWSPVTLRLPEFRLQVIAISICLIVTAAAPLWRRAGFAWSAAILIALSIAATIVTIAQFRAIRPALDHVYGRPIDIGWGPTVMVAGWVLLDISLVSLLRDNRR